MEYIHPHRESLRPIDVGSSPTHKTALFHQKNSGARRDAVLCEGFTLLEMLVVLAIIMVVTLVAITSQNSFNKTLILSNTAFDIALSIRSAAAYGLGSRGVSLGTANANAPYGLNFVTNTPTSYTLFADTMPNACAGQLPNCRIGNGVYTASSDIRIESYSLNNGIRVSDMCVVSGSTKLCANSGQGIGITSLDITFSRPNSDPIITANGASSPIYSSACIALTSPQGGFRYISVGTSGTIATTVTSCL